LVNNNNNKQKHNIKNNNNGNKAFPSFQEMKSNNNMVFYGASTPPHQQIINNNNNNNQDFEKLLAEISDESEYVSSVVTEFNDESDDYDDNINKPYQSLLSPKSKKMFDQVFNRQFM
jgi:hypothetical protein